MTVNIWKSCAWTANKEVNMKAIFTSNERFLNSSENKYVNSKINP